MICAESQTSDRGSHARQAWATATLALLIATSTHAADWPRFLGPNLDSISAETGINKAWSNSPPAELWRVPLADGGFAGPAVVGSVVYLHDHEGEEDIIRAVQLGTGKEVWRFAYAETGKEDHGFTRATPTVLDGRVYTISRSGLVHCLDAASGKKLWHADVMRDHVGKPPTWGAAHSAFIDGDQLVTLGAGTNSHVVALDLATGKERWSGGGTFVAGYATPQPVELDGNKQYLVFTGTAITGISPGDGTLLWQHPWKTKYDVNAASPVQVDHDLVWIASGYRSGCALLRVRGDQVEEVWKDQKISPHWSSAALIDGHLYTTTPPGYLVCVEAATGKEMWRSKGTARGFEHGGLIAVDGTLIVIEGNTGNVVQVEVSTEAYHELGRINPLESSRCWVAPVVAHGKLLVRSPEELVCLDLSL